MISAKNYAAQCQRDILYLSSNMDHHGDSFLLADIAALIGSSVHFAIPDGGRILDGGLSGIDGKEVFLPYPVITVEYVQNGEKALVLAMQSEDGLCVNSFYVVDGEWRPLPLVAFLANNWHEKTCQDLPVFEADEPREGGYRFLLKFAPIFDTLYKGINRDSQNIDYKKYGGNHSTTDIRAVFELLEALSCRNVSTANHQDASPVNNKRIKAGKLPFYETKMLVIDTNSGTSGKNGNGGGSHSSPRQHLRRGHIRRLEIGNIWVNSCVVGDPTKGVIKKQYSVL